MDAETILTLLQKGFRRSVRAEPGTQADLDTHAAHAFHGWLQRHRVSIAGLVRLTGLSRSTLTALSGAGDAVRWSTVTSSTVDRLLPFMRHVDPALTRDGLRRLLGLPDGPAWTPPDPDPSEWLTNVPLRVRGALAVHLVIDADDPAGPHVYRTSGRTVVSAEHIIDGQRLGKLISISPS